MTQPPTVTDGALEIDRFGAIASSLCAVHCLLSALLPALIGGLGLSALFGPAAEWIMTGLAISFALATLALGWRHHRSKLVLALISLGIMGLLGSRVIEMNSHHDHGAHEETVHEEEHHHGHDEASHDEAHHHEHEEAGHHEEEGHHDEGHHDDPMHALGTLIGVFAGLLLIGGHLVNLREVKRCKEHGCN